MRLHLEVLTIQGTVVDEEVDEVIVPLVDGWKGVLPGHLAFIARVMRGTITMRTGDRERIAATLGGTLTVEPARVTLLTGAAMLDRELADLEREISAELESIAAIEAEAEKHFDRVYQHMAETFKRGARRLS